RGTAAGRTGTPARSALGDTPRFPERLRLVTIRSTGGALPVRMPRAMAVTDTQAGADEVQFLDGPAQTGVNWLHERGAALFHERQLSDRVMVLLEGRVKIASVSEDGREAVLAFRGPGEVLGELSAIDGQPRSASVIAVDPVRA